MKPLRTCPAHKAVATSLVSITAVDTILPLTLQMLLFLLFLVFPIIFVTVVQERIFSCPGKIPYSSVTVSILSYLLVELRLYSM